MLVQRKMVVKEIPKCDQEGCERKAQYAVVWLKQQYYCHIHANTILNIGRAMGHPTPHETISVLVKEGEV